MSRPLPPASLLELSELSDFGIRLTPAPEVWEWLQSQILADTGSIHNEEHAHLIDADIRVMWASAAFTKKGRTVVGQAEQVAFRAGGWQKARMEQQMRDWFGDVPAYIITLAADYCADCSDADFCALIEHELYHIAQSTDKYGQPAFTQEGLPKLEITEEDRKALLGHKNGSITSHYSGAELGHLIEAANMVSATDSRGPVLTILKRKQA